jgi:tetratricopeptide (TPR) repeat protein
MSLPKAGTVATEKVGVAEVYRTTFLPREQGGLGFVFRELPNPDAGVDALIEVLDLERQVFTGRLIGVQVKGGSSWFDHPTDGGWGVYIEKSTVEYWENYSVPVILTLVDTDAGNIYWAVVSEGGHEEKETKYRITVPESQRFDATSGDAIADLATRAPHSLMETLETISNDLTEALSAELDRNRNAWREGRRTEARQWVQALAELPERLKASDPRIASQVLRWAAGTILDEDGELDTVRRLMEEANSLDPEADDLPLRAVLAARTESAQAALDLLGDPQRAPAQIAKASILLHLGRHDAARSVLSACSPDSDYEQADLHRLQAQISVMDGDLDGASHRVQEARSSRANDASVRLLEAQLMYFRGLPAPVRAGAIPPWPQPVPHELRAADEAALGYFAQAAEGFQLLLQLDWSAQEQRKVEGWRLASLCLSSESNAEASTFAAQVLRDDPAHPFVLLWATTDLPSIDVTAHLQHLEKEVERTENIGTALVYLALRANVDQTDGLAEWLDEWKERFFGAGAGKEWAFWRARVFLMGEDVDGARELLPELDLERQRVIEAGILRVEAGEAGDDTALIAHLESVHRDSGDAQWLLDACELHANQGRWAEVVPNLPELLRELPTPFVLRLAVFARYHTRNLRGCLELIDGILEEPGAGVDVCEYLRIRAVVRRMAGDVLGAVRDLEAVIARSEGDPPAEDLMALVQSRAIAGQSHEMMAVARQLKIRSDLNPPEALMLAETVAGDDLSLARDFWRIAEEGGIPDEHVARSMTLGYRLGLDRDLGRLHQRMVELASAGHPTVWVHKIDEVIELFQDQAEQHDRVLEIYRRGGTATHMVADFLRQPLAHFYHFLPSAHERHASLRHRFPIHGMPPFSVPGSMRV